MKCEFEKMIGKEVSTETFKIYEAMYMALPESIDKQQFVEMLKIKAIPGIVEKTAKKLGYKIIDKFGIDISSIVRLKIVDNEVVAVIDEFDTNIINIVQVYKD